MKSSFGPVVRLMIPALLLGALTLSGQLANKKGLTLAAAKKIAQAAEAEASKNKWNVVIAIVDEGGNLLYLQRMDGAQTGSIDVAMAKAQSAFRFKRPTKVFEDAVKGGRTVILSLPGAMPVEGGLPLMKDGQIIGAIGVSGVQSTEDAQLAEAGSAALGSMN